MAREIYYAVQHISTATPLNENFYGEVHMHIVGKDNYSLVYDTPDCHGNYNLLTPYFVREHAYKRKCDAKRNWTYNNPENNRFWKSEVTIVALWIRKDGTVCIEG